MVLRPRCGLHRRLIFSGGANCCLNTRSALVIVPLVPSQFKYFYSLHDIGMSFPFLLFPMFHHLRLRRTREGRESLFKATSQEQDTLDFNHYLLAPRPILLGN